ncbi:alpha-amylase family glycosyl hydrolase [Catenovulum agarivorans]|uniref:alpha-amylase family glycosyl hydrolase n=1 Tax=Catenovulum agarivorans TaxID=1172192 RepID=UPI0002EAFFBD|nr:alpha-amylase family glycosyl hydrolase [Catenovulum agarivorans]
MIQCGWWRGAVIYQIYPRSFYDSNNDGIGDLPGVYAQLDYIANLGVDAVWLSPFFKSPMKDYGYDISNYRQVDPVFGDVEDVKKIVAKAHSLGLKVLMDMVLCHTSDQHTWFKQSRSSKCNDKADWYIWVDPNDDGTPPNNWLSIFGGSAWEWDSHREQYYLHHFLSSQPSLNFHNSAVRQQMLDETEFWLQMGIDGFRFDAINFCFHDSLLTNNPAKCKDKRRGRGFSTDNPYAYQYHYYDNTRPENIAFIEDLRELLNQYPGAISLGEIAAEDSIETMAEYTHSNNRLHLAYNFELLTDECNASYLHQVINQVNQKITGGWPCWAIGNHDVVRVRNRWGGDKGSLAQTKLYHTLLLSLKGSACLYQGDELALPQADIEYVDLCDPYGIRFWPRFKGRDGCRTPMPWNEQLNCGFSQAKPWLPVAKGHSALAVSHQLQDGDSMLSFCKHLLSWRKNSEVMRLGEMKDLQVEGELLSFIRYDELVCILCILNLSDKPVDYKLAKNYALVEKNCFALGLYLQKGQQIKLSPYSALLVEIVATAE